MHIKRLHGLIFTSLLVVTVSIVPCRAQIERIYEVTLPHTVFDFEELPPGPTGIEQINAGHIRSLLAEITVIPSSHGSDDYDLCSNGISGQALGGNVDGSGEMGIFAVGELYDSADFTIDLLVPTTQFGFVAQDERFWPWLHFYLDNEQVDSYFWVHASRCDGFVGVESAQPFDRIEIAAGAAAGYLLDELFVPDLTPDMVPRLTLSKEYGGPTLHWTTSPLAAGYDVIRGKLRILRNTGGDFADATTTCLADDTLDDFLIDTWPPPPDRIRYYLVRMVNSSGWGTYDSGGAAQHARRDAAIEAGYNACP